MTELWYRAYRTVGGPKAVAQRIAAEVKRRNIGNHLPRICTEPSKSRGEFYFLMGINSENNGELPPAVSEFEKWLEFQNIRLVPGGEFVLRDDLTKSWLRREVDIEYTRLLSQWRTQPADLPLDNPFDLSKDSAAEVGHRVPYNQLLYWLSAYTAGGWQTFRNACAELGLESSNEPRHLFRRLRLLGHAEYLESGDSWTACPACLVETVDRDGKYQCVLAGARSATLTNKIEKSIVATRVNQGAPDTLVVCFDSREDAQELLLEINSALGYDLKLAGRASAKLADILPDISGWRRHLLKRISIDPGRYELRQWDGAEFAKWVDRPSEIGMYKMSDVALGNKSPTYYLFFDPEENQWLQGDWYGLRYLANLYLDMTPIFRYDETQQLLLIPREFRPPDIYERALVLASGELPRDVDAGLMFNKVSPDLVKVLSVKLEARIDGRSDNAV